MGLVYAVFMSVGWLLIRVPADDWKPAGWEPGAARTGGLITTANVSAANAIKTPQFWLLWVVLCFNVTAGIGILEKASPIYQDYFPDASSPQALGAAGRRLRRDPVAGQRAGPDRLVEPVRRARPQEHVPHLPRRRRAALPRDHPDAERRQGRLPDLRDLHPVVLRRGFATVPAYLRDLFGTYQVGAIHGRLLTAWSTAGVLGPLIVNAIADSQEAAGQRGPALYTLSFSIMIALLVVAFVCNELIKPVDAKWHEPTAGTSATERAGAQA
jgi:hypothetical protein